MKLLTILEDLIKIKSVSNDRIACNAVLTFTKAFINDHSYDQKHGVLLWGHQDLATSKWLINTHIDVVPGNPDQFQLRLIRDRAWGRGVVDAKGCAAILIENANRWDQLAKSKKITFMLVSDEEVGGHSTKVILPKMSMLQGAIFLEPSNLHITTLAKGMMQVKIVAEGTPCHGSRPWLGKNAIEQIMNCLIQFKLCHPTPTQETTNTTYNFSLLNGGSAINQVPSTAELFCDVRYNPTDDPSEIKNDIATCFKGCKVTLITCESPIICDHNSSVFTAVKKSFKAAGINPLTQFDHSTSDARHATALKIPALVFGPKGGGLHSESEWVSLKSLYKVQQILDHLINNI